MSNIKNTEKNYKGFSTRYYEDSGKGFGIYDIECVAEDLLNEIFTVKGDRIGMPTYGTRIPIMIFELNDIDAINIIREDLQTVFDNDPRVSVDKIDIVPLTDKNALVAVARIFYIEFKVTQDLMITINSQ